MNEAADSTSHYPPPGNPLLNGVRTAAAYSLLATQLVLLLFVLELPYWLYDRFLARVRGDGFFRAQRALARWFFRLYPFGQQRRVSVRASGFPGPCVIVANHQSLLDILLLLTLPVNARWFLRPWAMKLPLLGEMNRLAKHIAADDSPGVKADGTEVVRPKGYDAALEYLKQGISVLIMPEVGRSPNGEIRRFRGTAFRLAIEAGVPLVPVVLDGTGACVRRHSPVWGKADLKLQVLDAQETKGLQLGDADALKLRTQHAMHNALAGLRERNSFNRVNGWVTRLGMAAVALLLALVAGVSIYVNNWCIAQPPAYAGDRALAGETVRKSRISGYDVQQLGDNWRRDRLGIHEIALTGDRWQRGYANAKLTPDILKKQEAVLLEKINEFVPNRAAYWALKQFIAINNRRLPDYVTEAEKLEVLGLADASVDHYPDEGVPLYHRILNYHAAHDISHMLVDNPLLSKGDLVGCTGFAAWGPATANGDLLVGRNFDFEAGEVFDADKCVLYVWPDDGIAYVHVAWAGMAGAVTGMNAEGISVHINAARTDDSGFGRIGTPVTMVVRRVLEQARSIEDAHKIIREATVFVSDSFLVGSRSENRAVVIEKSPERCELREAYREGLILQTNHFLTATFKDDAANQEQIERATTLYRYERLKELTEREQGKLTPERVQAILRDRKGRGDKDIGIGNRNAIDAGICSHSVIMNLTRGELWVSASPHTYGHYVYINVARAIEAKAAGALRMSLQEGNNLPADAAISEGMNLAEFRKQVRQARAGIDAEDMKAAETTVRNLRHLNANAWETAYFEGRLAFLQKKYPDAVRHFERALDRDPAYEEVREHLRLWLSRAGNK